MPEVPQSVLHAKLRAALPRRTTVTSNADEVRPVEATIPDIGPTRIYLWTATHVESNSRPVDEFKIQLILPGQVRGERGALDFSGRRMTVLLGYSPDFGVFVAWDAQLHKEFSYSAAVQVKEATLDYARRNGWAVSPPRTVHEGREVRVAFTPGNLQHYLEVLRDADRGGISGTLREAFFLARTPHLQPIELPEKAAETSGFVRTLRQKLIVERFERDAKFGPLIKKQFDYACAVCGTQLEIVEGAHIIPVSVKESRDELWNGIAMCPNHHKLFDASAFIIKPDLAIKVDDDAIDFFTQSGRIGGVTSMLRAFDSQSVREPLFFSRDQDLRKKMKKALQWRERLAAIR